MINTTAITGIDLTKLPHKLVALLPDKETVYREFITPRQASWELDGKMECKYISRYVNVEKLVKNFCWILLLCKTS
jgi:hypothetical protein